MLTRSERSRLGRRNRKLGAQGERKIRHRMEERGFEVVRSTRSAGTYDLIAWRTKGGITRIRFVQVKARRIKPAERRAIMAHILESTLIVTKEVRYWYDNRKEVIEKARYKRVT